MVAILVGMAVPVTANHQQNEAGQTVTFDHRSGNEWWVEVQITGTISTVGWGVYVRDDGGAWILMENPSWAQNQGQYVKSFHIEPGHRVQFKLTKSSDVIESCWFTHPAGVEQCAMAPPPPPPGTFDTTFTAVRGNEWWVQANVASNGPSISKVDATLDNGVTWKPLAKQSWGATAWAASFRVVQGTVVQLRATATGGATDASDCYGWIPASNSDAGKVACGGDPPRPSIWSQAMTGSVFTDAPRLSVGDADRDGRSELYAASNDGLFRVGPSQTTFVSTLTEWGDLAVGDGDNDGKAEVYVMRRTTQGTSELHRLSWTGSAWTDALLPTAGHAYAGGPVTLGDVDNDGRVELYVAAALDDGCCSAGIVRVFHDGTAWRSETIIDLGDDGSFLDVWDLWVGDADRDGRLELAVLTGGRGYATAWVVEKEAPAAGQAPVWRATRMTSHSSIPGAIVAGDADGDGLGELVASNDMGDLSIFRRVNDVWTEQVVSVTPDGWFLDMALGDGDNDGRQEIYLTEYYTSKVYQVRFTNGAWQVTELGHLFVDDPSAESLVVGDFDEDGDREVSVSFYDDFGNRGYVHIISYGPAPPPFDATFSNVRGNDYWIEAMVKANEEIHMVTVDVDCAGETHDMAYNRDWNKYMLGGMYIPPGSKITITAWGGSGIEESTGYIWPNATPTTGC